MGMALWVVQVLLAVVFLGAGPVVFVVIRGVLLGITGALLAVPAAGIIRIVVTELLAYRRERQGEIRPGASSPHR